MTARPLDGVRVVVANWRDPWHRSAGGSERYAWELSRGLIEAGAEVEFWTARDRGQTRSSVVDDVLVRRRGGAYSFYVGIWARVLRRRITGSAPDLVFDMDCGIPTFTPLVLARRTAVVLVVHHVHQQQFATAMAAPVAALGRFLEKQAMRTVYRRRATIAVSESTVTQMREQLGWSGPVRVVHNGADEPRESGPASRHPDRICVLGRLVPHKRVDVVLAAFARLLLSRPGARLDVIGTGPSLPGLRVLAADLGLGDRVQFHGFVEESTKSRLLEVATVHVCASDAEGWGQVVVEAAAHGLATVGRDVPGIRDSVLDGVTGWLVAPTAGEDLATVLADGIAAALQEIAEPERADQVSQACRSHAHRFTWEGSRAALVELAVDQLTAVRRGS